MILYNDVYEREGNDAWLIDYVELHQNSIGFYLEHKKRWNGWNGEIKENYTVELDIDDLDKSQKIIDEHIEEHSLFCEFFSGHKEGIVINLKEILNIQE